MAKVQYTFCLDDDRNQVKIFEKSEELFHALWEIDQMVRTRLKHGGELSDEDERLYDLIREEAAFIHNIDVC